MKSRQYAKLVIVMALMAAPIMGCSDTFNRSSGGTPQNDKLITARKDLATIRSWLSEPVKKSIPEAVIIARQNIIRNVDEAVKNPNPDLVTALRRDCLSVLSLEQGGDGTCAISAAHSLEKVFLDEPYSDVFSKNLEIGLARNETEGGQLLIHSIGMELKKVTVTLDGRLTSRADKKLFLPASSVRINLVGYVDTTKGDRPYRSIKQGWWPDPVLPNRTFDVKADEVQPLLVSVTTTEKTKPGVYEGNISINVQDRKRIKMPVSVSVYNFVLPKRGHYATFALGCSPGIVAKYYGGDPGNEIMGRFVAEAFRNRMPPVELISGWGWNSPKVKKKIDGEYDFTPLDHYLKLFKESGVTRFPLAIVPRFRKFGGGEYTDAFKSEFINFITSYAGHLKKNGLFDAAVLYNIDEASNDPKLREWDVCKEIYRCVKQAVPDLPVIQCLNEKKGVKALSGYVDIWDLYFRQYDKSGGPERLNAGDTIMLSVCIWPSERPNIFIEYPLLDSRIMPWIGFRTGATGMEYWEMITSWKENYGNSDWWKNSTRTAWKLNKPHGDGLLIYPGPGGAPLSSLRLEALRDGIEDYEYLYRLSELAGKDPAAQLLLREAKESLVLGVTAYDDNPRKLLGLRRRIGEFLGEQDIL